jgi:hypothetical protein
MPNSDLLAVAFTDLNGNHKYNPGKDTLIAALVDTSNDNTVSVGDTVQFGTYPAIPDGVNSGIGGSYTILESTITDVVSASSTDIQVNTALGTVRWVANKDLAELFETFGTNAAIESALVDAITNPAASDRIFTIPSVSGPGQPNTTIDVTTEQLGDQAFLDVYIANWLF